MSINTLSTTGHHPSLTLAQLAPTLSAAFSPNLYKWMKAKANFYRDGGVYQAVFRVKPDTRLARSWGTGTLVIGYASNEYEGDTDFIGTRLMSVLCQGVEASSACHPGLAADLEEVDGFWDRYLAVGRCAVDPEHREQFVGGDRYIEVGGRKACVWCGAECAHQA